MCYQRCKKCNAKTISPFSVVGAYKERPHVCKNCEAKSYMPEKYNVQFKWVMSFFVTICFVLVYVLKFPWVYGFFSFPFCICGAYKIVYKRKTWSDRVYLPR